MHKLVVDKEGNIIIDGKIVEKKDIGYEFLNRILKFSLQKDIEFFLDENANISNLFKQIQSECSEETEFYKKWDQNRKQYFEVAEKLDLMQNSDDDK